MKAKDLQDAAPAGEYPGQALLEEAADWAITLHHDDAGPAEWQRFEHWRSQSMAHRAAWERVCRVLGKFEPARSGLGRGSLRKLQDMERRRALRVLTGLAVAVPAGWLAGRACVALGKVAGRCVVGAGRTPHAGPA